MVIPRTTGACAAAAPTAAASQQAMSIGVRMAKFPICGRILGSDFPRLESRMQCPKWWLARGRGHRLGRVAWWQFLTFGHSRLGRIAQLVEQLNFKHFGNALLIGNA